MHELTIATADATGTTSHHDFDAAYRGLMRHVITQDLYLHPQHPSPRAATVFTLLAVGDATGDSRVVGTATITESPTPAVALQHCASAALDRTARGANPT